MSTSIPRIAEQLVAHMSQALVGKQTAILHTLACLVAGGHVLLEDVPGLGKTTLAKALAQSFDVRFQRIQCTPDLMPSDITGVSIFHPQKQAFEFIEGPIFTQVLLADEINRTSARTQSALLEAMAEGTVTVDRQTYRLPEPFFVIATQNPIEFAGTYPLPEAQMDRFMMRISLGYPDAASEAAMLQMRSQEHTPALRPLLSAAQLMQLRRHAEALPVSEAMRHYIVRLAEATRAHPDVLLGASPRASLALMKAARALALLQGLNALRPQTVQSLAPAVLGHRLLFKNRQSSAAQLDAFFRSLLESVPVPDHPASA